MATTALEEAVRSQPAALRRMLDVDLTPAVGVLGNLSRLWLVGTGTSEHAAELGALFLRDAGRQAFAVPSMVAAQWPPFAPGDGVVVLTHTGETAYALAVCEHARSSGLPVVPLTGTDAGLPGALMTVPHERAETYTVSYTTALLLLARLALALGRPRYTQEDPEGGPDAVGHALEVPGIQEIDPPLRLLVLAATGAAAITAREGALKVREAARALAEGFDAEYLLHGNAVPLGSSDHLLLLNPPDDRDGFLAALGRAAKGAGLRVTALRETADLPPLLAQLPLTARLQLLALRFAGLRSWDPDKVIVGAWDDPVLWALGKP